MSSARSETLTGTLETAFPEYTSPPAEPMGLLSAWLDEAERLQVREPRALALATADDRGRPSSRIVVLSRVTAEGLLFVTHRDSRKGRELAANPWASGLLYWRESSRQISLAGPVESLPDTEADALWAARAVFTHAMTAASRQSEPLDGPDAVAELRDRATLLAAEGPLPRPASFTAYLLRPGHVEFWANGTDRLHERLVYERAADGWSVARLQP
ncbi:MULTISPECIES: phenazine biosynthesis FMN-dependent oxidase PhzG [Streptomyces]|uniref:phenazine biosynthesis FMN-dependent oxidase PhzG n=1 Tax=Streptomyces TaxID=1883 RepID=UPI0004C7378C|nr:MULTISPECIES: phenazine biosynthesis FMN-dependent oxidase PhzG [Streptomyces]RPK83956.1 Phenazine biosynthesis protein PhzG [Streptomyces sp. ADI98-10]